MQHKEESKAYYCQEMLQNVVNKNVLSLFLMNAVLLIERISVGSSIMSAG